MAKRAFDLVVSVLALMLVSPVLLVIALAVKIDSAGPVLYRQRRVGRAGRSFTILKFRTMHHDAGRMAANVSPADDPRITRVGRSLRRWYLDELPQLFNVVTGDMSLVGPRPETPEFVALYSEEERRVLSVRPGIAGPSTLAFMDEGDLLAGADDPNIYYIARVLHERVRLDLQYLDRVSISDDVRLLAKQVVAIVRR